MRADLEGLNRPGRRGRGLPALGLVLTALLPALGSAQEGRTLSLGDALSRAREFNPDYRMARNELELSAVGRREALGAFLPSLNLSAGTGISFDRQLVSQDPFGNPIENPETEWQTSSNSSQTLSGSVTLFEGGRRFYQLSVQGARARVRETTVGSRLRTIRSGVIRAYSSAQRQQALLVVERDLLEGRRLDLEMTRRRFDLAGATRVDVLTAELNVQRQEQGIQETLAQYQQGLLTLRRTIGDPELTEFVLSETPPSPFDPGTLDPDELVGIAMTTSPLILQERAQIDLGDAQKKAAKGSRWPSLSMSFGVNQRVFAQERAALFDMNPDQSRYGSASFNLTIPLFSRFQTSARIAEAQVGLDNAKETLRRVQLQIDQEVRSRLIQLQTAYLGYEMAVRSREIAQERLGLARDQFRLGSRTFTELQQDIDASASAERAVITQLFGFVEAQVNLEESVGELRPGNGGGN